MTPKILQRAARVLAATTLAVIAIACGRGSPAADGASDSGVEERNVRFETSDGLVLTGRLFGHGRVGLSLAHMYPADATSWYPAARRLASAGYMAIAFNFRGYANSEGDKQILKAPVDIRAAQRVLRRSGARMFAFVGASMGGTASIVAAEELDPLAVVTVSAPLRFMGLDAPSVAGRVARPVLLIAARSDGPAFEAVGEFERSLPNPETKLYEGDAHGTNLLNARPGAVDEIIAFLRRYAPVAGTVPSSSP